MYYFFRKRAALSLLENQLAMSTQVSVKIEMFAGNILQNTFCTFHCMLLSCAHPKCRFTPICCATGAETLLLLTAYCILLLAYGGFPPSLHAFFIAERRTELRHMNHSRRGVVSCWHANTIQQRDTACNCTKRSRNFWATAGGGFLAQGNNRRGSNSCLTIVRPALYRQRQPATNSPPAIHDADGHCTRNCSCITLLWLHHNHIMSISYHNNGLGSSHQSVGSWFIFMCFLLRIFC